MSSVTATEWQLALPATIQADHIGERSVASELEQVDQ